MSRLTIERDNEAVRKHRRFSSLLSLLLGILAFFGLGIEAVQSQPFCNITQITDTTTGANDRPAINADGTRIAFRSNSDITGANPDQNSEIFLFDTNTMMFMQITDTAGSSNLDPAINVDGTRIAFESNHDITGGNNDGNVEIFLSDLSTMTITQITDTLGGGDFSNRGPTINADGTRIAFESNRDLTGTGSNADANIEVFLFDTSTMTTTQVTVTTGSINPFLGPAINPDGTLIAFSSDRDLTGGNPDLNAEIFLYNTNTLAVKQVTNTLGFNGNLDPAINSSGSAIVFNSDRDIFPGGNPDNNFEIFLAFPFADLILGAQVTNSVGILGSGLPTINADGTRIAFQSDRELIPSGNPDLNDEIFLYDTTTMHLQQITDTMGNAISNLRPTINAEGTKVAFRSSANIVGTNPDTNSEIFLAHMPKGCTFATVDKLQLLKHFVAGCVVCPPKPLAFLVRKVELAMKQVIKGNIRPAVEAVGQFVSKSAMFVRMNELPPEVGQRFIAKGMEIEAELEVGLPRRP